MKLRKTALTVFLGFHLKVLEAGKMMSSYAIALIKVVA